MIKDMSSLVESIKEDIRSEMDIAVLGLSGGVDSLVCACLVTLALGERNVYCIHMPHNDTDYTPGKFNSNSMRIAKKLKVKSMLSPIGPATSEITRLITDEFGSINTLNEGNSRARVRMSIVYGIGHEIEFNLKKRVRVIGTGNLSEDFIGYDNKGGDALADIFLIGELLKSEVYQLAEHFVERGLIDKNMIDYHPSAGLWDGQTDEDELGYSYAAMEPSIIKLRNPETGLSYQGYETSIAGINRTPLSEIDKFVLNRHWANRHKHLAVPSLSIREYCE